MIIYYDSRTGNVYRFINKLKKIFVEHNEAVEFIKLDDYVNADKEGHLITYTDGFGEMPKVTEKFLDRNTNSSKILSVSSSGNMNWGENYARASALIAKKYAIPIVMNFELSGTHSDALNYYSRINEL